MLGGGDLDYAAVLALGVALLTFLSTQWGLTRMANKERVERRIDALEECKESLAEVQRELEANRRELFSALLRLNRLEGKVQRVEENQ